MAHAEKCPICEGSGRLPLPVEMGTSASRPYDKLCHGCGGKGWVSVQDEIVTVLSPLSGDDLRWPNTTCTTNERTWEALPTIT